MPWTSWRALSALWCVTMLGLLVPETTAQWPGQSYALVVGIDTYRAPTWRALGYAVKDAKVMATFLQAQGFEVTTLYNQHATKEAIIYQLQNVFAPRLKPGDRVLVFFAGHGSTERLSGVDYGYIVPHDAKDYSATYISMEELLALSRKMGDASHQLFLMDACYGGLLGVRGGALDERRADYIPEVIRRKARQILTAGGANQQVVDNGPEGHSVFTGFLLKALRDGSRISMGTGISLLSN
jgi:uncharacterized caspase-like protein